MKSEYNTSNKNKRIFKANSNISCETNVSTFDKENKYVKSFNTSNKKKGKKINIQSDYVVTNLCTGFIPVKEKCKVNYNLDEKLKLTKYFFNLKIFIFMNYYTKIYLNIFIIL